MTDLEQILQRLDELERVEKDATPGKVRFDMGNLQIEMQGDRMPVADISTHYDLMDRQDFIPEHLENGEKMAVAWNALPALTKALRGVVKTMQTHINGCFDMRCSDCPLFRKHLEQIRILLCSEGEE